MNFNIDKIFAGVIDFFAILLPGAFLTFFLMGRVQPLLVGEDKFFQEIPKSYGGVAFLIIAYIIGHFVNSFGAQILDGIYNKYGWRIFDKNYNLTFLAARSICNEYLPNKDLKEKYFDIDEFLKTKYSNKFRKKNPDIPADEFDAKAKAACIQDNKVEVVNTYQWSKRMFTLHKTEALSEVNRLEADQKFFRSLVIVSLVIGLWLIGEAIWGSDKNKYAIWGALGSFVILFFSLIQYANYRRKNTDLAFQFLIALHYANKMPKKDPS